VPEHGERARTVSKPGSILILVHDHIHWPVQPILHAPVLADDLVEWLRLQGDAETQARTADPFGLLPSR